jgi:hypothetical protein
LARPRGDLGMPATISITSQSDAVRGNLDQLRSQGGADVLGMPRTGDLVVQADLAKSLRDVATGRGRCTAVRWVSAWSSSWPRVVGC